MQITGERRLPYTRDAVWAALLDADVLQRATPGCERLVPAGPDVFDAEITIGVAAIKGRYKGTVRFSDLEPPHRYRMTVDGAGAPGRLHAEGALRLTTIDGGTALTYTGDARVAGRVAALGQRLQRAVARRLIDQFFDRFERKLAQRDGARGG